MKKIKIEKIFLFLGIILALVLNEGISLLSLSSTLALIFGFLNIYFTVNRSRWFIIPDLLWIFFTFITLYLTANYSDVPLYIFYTFVGFMQYFEWKKYSENGKFSIIYDNSKLIYFLIAAIVFMVIDIVVLFGYSQNLVLGAFISGFGIVASVMLAKRYYSSQIIFLFVNFAQAILYLKSGLYSLSLIPIIFGIFSLVFLIKNKE